MPKVLLFHHVQGLTPGVTAFADMLRAAGHTVYVPDLLDGRLFGSIPEGIAYVKSFGFQTIIDRGIAAAATLPQDLVYIGMSLGVMPAQSLAQTRPGALGAVLLHGAVTVNEFSPTWPRQVPVHFGCSSAPISTRCPLRTPLLNGRRISAPIGLSPTSRSGLKRRILLLVLPLSTSIFLLNQRTRSLSTGRSAR